MMNYYTVDNTGSGIYLPFKADLDHPDHPVGIGYLAEVYHLFINGYNGFSPSSTCRTTEVLQLMVKENRRTKR